MASKCENCTEKCPQAERAHQAALGRMYATNEFIALLKEKESRDKPKTNADRIRAMSDEELAEFIYKNLSQEYTQNCFLEWLKQPAEE